MHHARPLGVHSSGRKQSRRKHKSGSPLAERLEPRCLLAADLVISEIMASNANTLKDVDGAYSEWIELRNQGDATANLDGWYLTDDPNNLTQWKFPAVTLAPGAHLVVFASGKNYAVAGAQLHTNFGLDAEGEYLALVTPGQIIQEEFAPSFPAQQPDVSYGIGTDGTYQYFQQPTPGAANQTGTPTIASKPVFSVSSRTFTDDFTLTITTNVPNATIRYTTDRSSPTSFSSRYRGPINISRTTVVRARVFASGLQASAIVTATYVKLDSTVSSFESNLPIVILDTFGQGLSDTTLRTTSAYFIDTSDVTGRATMTDLPDYAGRAGLRVRGQSSQSFPKQQYAFETWDENSDDMAVPILGMPSESDWILYAPYSEKSLMQNALAYEWSNRMGQYAVRTRYVEVFFNKDNTSSINYSSDYAGIYIFMEKIKIDGDRVDIEKLLPNDNTEPNISGGYIFKNDKDDSGETTFTTNRGYQFNFHDPSDVELSQQQKDWLRNYLNEFESVLYGPNFKDPVNGYAKYIDVQSWIDHHIMVEMAKNIDGFRISTYYHKDRNGKIKMGPVWDYNLSMGNANYNNGNSPTGWYYSILNDNDYRYFRRLFEDPDFQQRWIDRWQELRRDKFSTERLMKDVDQLVTLLSDGNGNYPVGQYPTQESNNPVVRNFKRWNILGSYVWPNAVYFPAWIDEVNWMKDWLTQRFNWMDSLYLASPQMSQKGGTTTEPLQLSITAPSNSTLYYTTDGTDPRLPGGALNPNARVYSGPITIIGSTRVMARAFRSPSIWSGVVSEAYSFPAGLRITEIMYNPAAPPAGSPYTAQDFEYIELLNTNSTPIEIGGMKFTKGVDLTIPARTLAAGERVVVVRNRTAFQSRYGTSVTIAGVYGGSLDNAGEKVQLSDAAGLLLQEIDYNDSWYPHTDGGGFALVAVDPLAGDAVLASKDGWRASWSAGGAPGQPDPGLNPNAVLINEILTHTDQPDGDWIELYNNSDQDLDLSGWFLSDSSTDLAKYRIPPGTILPQGQYLLLTQAQHFGSQFGLSELGEAVYLTSVDPLGQPGGYRQSEDFAAAAGEVTFGRYLKSTGGKDFVALSSPTPGGPNSLPLVGPVVINEIMYGPALEGDEYIELYNFSGSVVPLYDPLYPANTWQFTRGVTYSFPQGASVPAFGYVLVTGLDPALFRSKYAIPASVPIYGPWTGVLDNAGETVELVRPGNPELDGTVPLIGVEKVTYAAQSPWPLRPNGQGPSLGRYQASAYGNDPSNWLSDNQGGSPGRENLGQVPPTLDLPDSRTTSEGANLLYTGRFGDPNEGQQWTASINYGDGSATQLLTLNADQSFTLNYRYPKPGVYTLTLSIQDSAGGSVSDSMLVNVLPSTQIGTAGDDQFLVRLDSSGTLVEVYANRTLSQGPTFSFPLALLQQLRFEGLGGNDLLTVDLSQGNPLPPLGLVYNGGSQSNLPGDQLVVVGDGASIGSYTPGTQLPGSGTLDLGGRLVGFTDLEPVLVRNFARFTLITPAGEDQLLIESPQTHQTRVSGSSGGLGFETLWVESSGELIVDAGLTEAAAGAANDTITLGSGGMGGVTKLTLLGGGGQDLLEATAGSSVVHLGPGSGSWRVAARYRSLLELSSDGTLAELLLAEQAGVSLGGLLRAEQVTVGAQALLDVNQSLLVVNQGTLASLASWVASGRGSGGWDGLGISSSAAVAQKLLGVAVLANDRGDGTKCKAEEALGAILIQATWYGDVNLDGQVNLSDYFTIDSGYLNQRSGFAHGDMNYDGEINLNDYFLIDSAYLGQGKTLGGVSAAVAATTPVQKSQQQRKQSKASLKKSAAAKRKQIQKVRYSTKRIRLGK